MISNILRGKVKLQQRVATQGALGQTVVWKPIYEYHARVISLDAITVRQYMQLNTQVSHKVVLRGTVDIDLGSHRFVHGGKTYLPQESAKHYSGVTEVMVREE